MANRKNNNLYIPRSVTFDTSDSDNTANFLPRYYKTDANRKFLHSTINQLVQPGVAKKVSGYIGRMTAKATKYDDIFVDAATVLRQNYQLEPGFVIDDKLGNTTFFKDYQDYINQLDVNGSNVSVHSRLNKQELYSWDPHIDWDKISNFQNYYWLPNGPDVVTIRNVKLKDSTLEYSVKSTTTNEYVFSPDGLTKNPTIKLYRGQTYTFKINSPKQPFSFKTERTVSSLDNYKPTTLTTDVFVTAKDSTGKTIKDENGKVVKQMVYEVTKGTITFTVPIDAPNKLFYSSSNNLELSGVIEVLNLEDGADFDVDSEILGKSKYTLINGLKLSNGMKVRFAGNVTPVEYASGNFYVEGVGSSIQLVPESQLEAVTPYTTSETMLFDIELFDAVPFDDAISYSGTPDYVVINRGSNDKNFWSRNNKWFHKDVIEASALYNNIQPLIDQSMRAVRPIIEFEKNLKLFNFGTYAINDVSFVDQYTTDAFSTIEGSLGYSVDGIPLAHGDTIIFAAEKDELVKNNIYQVEFIDVKHEISKLGASRQIRLVLIDTPGYNQVAIVKRGKTLQGKTFWFNGLTWVEAQQKTKINQFPLFDMFDDNGVSFSDKSEYLGSSFKGTTVFSYKVGTGAIDPKLGFPLSYKNISNIGDIVFDFSLLSDTFLYELNGTNVTRKIDNGFLVVANFNDYTFVNGWKTCTIENTQPAIQLYINSGLTNDFNIDMFDGLPDDINVRVYVNNERVSNWSIYVINRTDVKSACYSVVFDTPVSLSDSVLIKVYSNHPINRNGYYEIPINLQNNPLNGILTEFTLGEVVNHVDSIIDHVYYSLLDQNVVFDNNLRDIGSVTEYGTKFVQHSGPIGLSLYHVASDDNNVIRAIEKSRDDYCRFKRAFITVAETMGVDKETPEHVDLILEKLTENMPVTSPYYFSDMVPFGASIKTNIVVGSHTSGVFSLAKPFSLDVLSNKSVTVYLNQVQLLHGCEYTFSDQGFVYISVNLEVDDIVTIVEYENTDGCLVPETPTKLGMWPKFEPKIYLDTTLITPMNVIQGHDGSIIVAYNDYRDDLLLELEKRIYNNIKVKYDTTIFDIHDFIPAFNQQNDYTLEEFNLALLPNYHKWSLNTGIDFSTPLSYDKTNSFTHLYESNATTATPKFWRGIYQWMLGTDRPHICPWEMLGFSEEPLWWVSVYGPAPYTSNNLILWEDLSNGLVKEPNKSEVVLEKYVRPYVATHIPVNENGELISPFDAMLAHSLGASSQGSFTFGDISPVESAWRRNSHYQFSVIKTLILLYPSKIIGLLIDRSRIKRNLVNQLVYTETGTRLKISDIVFPSVYLTETRVQTAGLINFLINNINCDSLTFYNEYKYNLKMLSARICYRVGGFTSKEKFNLLLDSKTPTSTGSIFIPQENYKIRLNTSSPVTMISYSGVIITKIQGGFEIKGYSQSNPIFNYFEGSSGYDVTVGSISESYTPWNAYQTYISGSIVMYAGKYYRVSSTFTASGEFDRLNLVGLASLPMVGGATAVFNRVWDRSTVKSIPYGTKLYSIQEVVDFLLGYGEWLTSEGFEFEEYNEKMSAVINWQTSAKEFLFWTTQKWAANKETYNTWEEWTSGNTYTFGSIVRYNGKYYKALHTITNTVFDQNEYLLLENVDLTGSSVLALSPGAKSLVFKTVLSVVDSIINPNNLYELLDGNGKPIRPHVMNTYRSDNFVSYTPTTEVGIYCATFYLIQKEHVVILDNTTMFNDIIYNPESGYKQDRIKVSGYVSAEWNGSLNVPGFIVDQAIVNEWVPWKEYALGDIVVYRSYYYSAIQFLQGTETFDETMWVMLSSKPTPGLLPNWNYKATQFTDFYSLESENFDVGQQKMAQHLTGYQKREYLENIIQDDVSEFKFYQGMIIEKGTQNVLNKLFDVLSADGQDSLKFYEEWAVRSGQYGASSAFENIEFVLDESLFKINPQGFELVDYPITIKDLIIRQTPKDLYLTPFGYKPNIWPSVKTITKNAVYARNEEFSKVLVSIDDLASADITTYVDNEYVSCTFSADNTWNAYQYRVLDLPVIEIISLNINKTQLRFTVSKTPVLVDEYIGIISEVTNLNGFFKVVQATTDTFTIDTQPVTVPTEFTGIMLSVLTNRRVDSIDDSTYNIDDVTNGSLLWTNNTDNQWKTWEYQTVYVQSIKENFDQQMQNYARAVAVNSTSTTMVVSATYTKPNDVTQYGTALIYNRDRTTDSWILRQTIVNPLFGTGYVSSNPETICKAVAISNDGTWIALGSPGTSNTKGIVSIYKVDDAGMYNLEKTIVSPANQIGENFGSILKFNNNMLFVGTAVNKLYVLKFKLFSHAERLYNPKGSIGVSLFVSSTADIEKGMSIFGDGFDGTQTVVEVGSNNRLVLSSAPISTPSGFLSFVSYDWVVNETLTGSTNYFGNSFSISLSNFLVVSDSHDDLGKVFTYEQDAEGYFGEPVDIIVPIDNETLFGSNVAVSSNGGYISIVCTVDDIEQIETFIRGDYLNIIFNAVGNHVQFVNLNKTMIVSTIGIQNVTVDVYDMYETKWVFSERLLATNGTGYAANVVSTSRNILIGLPENGSGKIYEYTKPRNAYSWTVKNYAIDKPDPHKIKQAFLYNRVTNELIKYLDVVDSVNGKHPKIAEQELKFKSAYDPAVYSSGTSTIVNIDSGIAWGPEQVGSLWWDLRTATFIDCFANDIIYRTSTLSTLAAGASIDIYEWVESKLLPEAWDTQADTIAGLTAGISGKSIYGNTAYSEIKKYDTVGRRYISTYYFWVKNKQTTPAVNGRTISAYDVSNLISNPKGEGYEFLSLTGLNSFSLVNIQHLLSHKDVVLSVEYWLTDKIDQNIHTQWKLISSSPYSTIPSNIEQKWVDSLCGKDIQERMVPDQTLPIKLRYGIENRPRQGMFINRFEALKQYFEQVNAVLKKHLIVESRNLTALYKFDSIPSENQALSDVTVDTYADLAYESANYYLKPSLKPIISHGRIINIIIDHPGKGYITAPYINVHGTGKNAKVRATINSLGEITGCQILNRGEGYADNTVLTVRSYCALVLSDENTNNQWCVYSYDVNNNLWSKVRSQAYDVTRYWNTIDWYDTNYNEFTTIDFSIDTYTDLNTIDVAIGQKVKIQYTLSNNWVLLEKYANSTSYDWTESYKIIGSENGTIQFSKLLYDFLNSPIGYDGLLYDNWVYDNCAGIEIRYILNAIKNDLLIDDLSTEYLNLFFSNVRYALSEQNYIDWIFKTSFVNVTHNIGKLHQSTTYKNDNLSNFEDYVSEVKPYRTQVREYVSAYSNFENNELMVTDFDMPPIYDHNYKTVNTINTRIVDGIITFDNLSINEYPWKSWYDNLGFSVDSIKLIDGGSEYITEPVVKIESAVGSGATARAFISNGKVTRIKLMTAGSGYLTIPTVTIVGGFASSGTEAKAVVTLGKGVIRSNMTTIKFDRITQNVLVSDLTHTDTLTGSGSKVQFSLSWAPDLGVGNTTVKVNGVILIRDMYTLQVTSSSGIHSGNITFNAAPALGSTITVTYLKNVTLLNAVDRIEHYYNPQVGDIGKDLAQLMTGIDYGGVIVSGLTFGAATGWGVSGFSSGKWDATASISNYKVTIPRDEYQIILPYTPEFGARLNVYYDNGSGAQPVRIDDPNFTLTGNNDNNPNAVMLTPVCTGVDNIVEIPKWFTHEFDSYTFIIRDERSDGSEETTDYDVSLNGGTFEYMSASGFLTEDLIIDGDKFDSNWPGPEEIVPGHVIDTIAIKVYTADNTGAYMQFKDMLNRVTYKRLASNKQTMLARSLKYNDSTILVDDASNFEVPDPSVNMPGIVFINGERIEYFTIVDNELGQLRRGTLGTGIVEEYPIGTDVQELGSTETIPYNETTVIHQATLADNTILIKTAADTAYGDSFVVLVPFVPKRARVKWKYSVGIPATYGQCDEVEVFIGGYNYGAVWVSNAQYYINDVVTVGSYVYKCVTDHISTVFSNDFNVDITKSKWIFFVGNTRLQKEPYTVYNERLVSITNPTGEQQFPADFSVNGKYKEIRISNTFNLAQNTVITVVKKMGHTWSDTGTEVTFIQAVDQSEFR
jgi:hypothetical protein